MPKSSLTKTALKSLRVINPQDITKAVHDACIKANIIMRPDVYNALSAAHKQETNELAKFGLATILNNAFDAKQNNLPLCQDTGLVVVFCDIGRYAHVAGNLEQAINKGVSMAYYSSNFRHSIKNIDDCLFNTAGNTQKIQEKEFENRKHLLNYNLPAVIHYDFIDGDKISITVAPKGFGSENMGAVKMLKPSDGLDGVKNFIIDTVKQAGANPCPPIVVGVGIGGTLEKCAILAKKATMSDINSINADVNLANLENELLNDINNLDIGACGFGGKNTCLAVKIKSYPTHIAGLPVAVNISCHCLRHEKVIL